MEKISKNNQRLVTERYSELFPLDTFRKERSHFLVLDPAAAVSMWSPATMEPTQNEERRSPSPVLPTLRLPIHRNRRRKLELPNLEAILRPVIKPKVDCRIHSEVTNANPACIKAVRPDSGPTHLVNEDRSFTGIVQGKNPKVDSSEKTVDSVHVQPISDKSVGITKSMAISNFINHDPLPTMREPHKVETTEIGFCRSDTLPSTIPDVTVIEESVGDVRVEDVGAPQVLMAAFEGDKVEGLDMAINNFAPLEFKTHETYVASTVVSVSEKSDRNPTNILEQTDEDGMFSNPSTSLGVSGPRIFDCIEVRSDFENVGLSYQSFVNPFV